MGLTRFLACASVAATLCGGSIASAQSSASADAACADAHFLIGEWEVKTGDGRLAAEVVFDHPQCLVNRCSPISPDVGIGHVVSPGPCRIVLSVGCRMQVRGSGSAGRGSGSLELVVVGVGFCEREGEWSERFDLGVP